MTTEAIASAIGLAILAAVVIAAMTAHACRLDATAACMEDGSHAEYVRCVSR